MSELPAFIASIVWRENACQKGLCAYVIGSSRAALQRLSIRITLSRYDSGDEGKSCLIFVVLHRNQNSPEFFRKGAELAN